MMHFCIRNLFCLYIISVKYTCLMAADGEKTQFPPSMWVCSYSPVSIFLNAHVLQGCGITDTVIIGVVLLI